MENKMNALLDGELDQVVGGISEMAGNENARILGLVDSLIQSGAFSAKDVNILNTAKEKLKEAALSGDYGMSLYRVAEYIKDMQDKVQAQRLIDELMKLTKLR